MNILHISHCDDKAAEINKDIGLPVVEIKAQRPRILQINSGVVSQWKAPVQR